MEQKLKEIQLILQMYSEEEEEKKILSFSQFIFANYYFEAI